MDVVANGPAAKAKLRVGDRVVAVDGKPAPGLSLAELRERLRTEPVGTRVELTVESRGKRRTAIVVLADLV
jgi:carboxyl-terminal processing protease